MLFGVGINDAEYTVQVKKKNPYKLVWVCPYYRRWQSMLRRCFDNKFLINNPNYAGCSVSSKWLTFSNFRNWCVSQCELYQLDISNCEVDKDFLEIGNKEYSPEKCLLLEKSLNCLFADSAASRGEFPIGVSYDKNKDKFISRISKYGVCHWLGVFDTPEAAHNEWKQERISYLKELATNLVKLYDGKVSESINKRLMLLN